jgi:HlyD family secretion protein
VQPGQVVIVLAQLERLKIETTDLSELDVAAVKAGQPATVYVEALDQEFPGTVTAIAPISDTLGSDVVFKVTIELEAQPADLLSGMSADVEIKTE